MLYLNLSRSIQSCLLLTSLLTITSCSSQPKITEKNISEILSGIDRAVASKDVSGIVANISNTAKIEVEDAASGKSMSFTKETYQKYSEEGFKVVNDYKSSRTNPQITIASNGESATATDVVDESVTINGKPMAMSTTESATFGLENGKVVITAIKGSMTIKK
jgi:hypothetical protein